MSGHSHFRTIMHKKGAADAKRSQTFSKLARELQIAAKEGGADPATNPRLRQVMEKAREAHMPSENIERAMQRAVGGDAGQLEDILIEAYGPGGIALLISAITDNKNRTLGAIKQILERYGGKLAAEGSARWAFDKQGHSWIAKFPTKAPQEQRVHLMQLREALEEQDDVQAVYANI